MPIRAFQSFTDGQSDSLSINMFDARQDGATDDTAAIQNAMDTAAALAIPIMVPGGAPFLATALRLPSGLIMFGRPGARILQRDGSAVGSTPFITNATTGGGGNSDILIQGITFDANAANQSVGNVDTIKLRNVSRIFFRGCKFKNAKRAHIYGQLLTGIDIEDCDFDNWGLAADPSGNTGNIGAIYLSSRASDNFAGPGGAITGIRIRGGTIDGRTSHSSCLKIDADAANPIRGIQISNVIVYPGDNEVNDTLGIELYSGLSSPGFSQFSIDSCTVIGENNSNDGIFGISLGGCGGTHGSVVGCHVKDCRAFGIETIASHVVVAGNTSDGCGSWSVDAGSVSLTDVDISHNRITEPVLQSGIRIGLHVIAHHTSGVGPYDITGLNISHNYISSSDPTFVNSLIVVENQTAGTIRSVKITVNELVGGGAGSGQGIGIGPNVGPCVGVTVQDNVCRNLTTGISPGGTSGRYLFNRFDNVTTQYGGSFDPTDMVVEVDSALGHFSPQSLRIQGTNNPVLRSGGDISLPGETAALVNDTQSPGNPNVFAVTAVNFGTELQGGFVAVNSRWNGFPNWIKTSANAYNRAMFMRLAAAQFAVMFGAATNALGADPGTEAFGVIDGANTHGEAQRVFCGSGFPLFMDGGANFSPGTALRPLKLDALKNLATGLIDLLADVVNALPISNGGTGATTAAGARSNLGAASSSDLTALTARVSSLETRMTTAEGNISGLSSGKADHQHIASVPADI